MAIKSASPIKTQTRKIDGLSIRYAESAPRGVSAILLSPWPESLYTFEQMWSRLAEHAHLVAIDLPGFGHSEGRTDLFTPSAMGEFVVQVINSFGLTRPHAVGPDIGTGTLLSVAAKHPGLLRGIVLGNGTAAVPIQIGSVLKDVVFAPSLDPFRNIDTRQAVNSIRRIATIRPLLSYGTSDSCEAPANDSDTGADHYRRSRYRSAPGERRLPARATASQQIRQDRRRTLRLGRRRRQVGRADHRLVGRRRRAVVRLMRTLVGQPNPLSPCPPRGRWLRHCLVGLQPPPSALNSAI